MVWADADVWEQRTASTLGAKVLKMEAACSCKTLVSTYKLTRHCNPEHQHRHLHRRENLESHVTYFNNINVQTILFSHNCLRLRYGSLRTGMEQNSVIDA
jgi:hypothetical protein